MASPCFVAHRRSVNHILNVCSFPRSSCALPDNKNTARNFVLAPFLLWRRHALLCFVAFLLSRLPCFHYWALCFVVVRRSLGHALYVRSLLRVFHASPTEKYTALNVVAEEINPLNPSSSPAGGDPGTATVKRTITFELGNCIAETNR